MDKQWLSWIPPATHSRMRGVGVTIFKVVLVLEDETETLAGADKAAPTMDEMIRAVKNIYCNRKSFISLLYMSFGSGWMVVLLHTFF